MKLLLDTHIWVWSLLSPQKLSSVVSAELVSPANELWLSPISTWEVLLLVERGRIVVRGNPVAFIEELLAALPRREAPVTHAVAIESRRIELAHQAPADRFLAATARVYDLTLVTADERLLHAGGISILANQ